MNAYRSLFIARFALLLQYRAAALAGIATQLFWGLMKVMVLKAFFSHTTAAQPMTFQEAAGYVWLGQAFILAIVPWSGDREIQSLIRSGAIGYDLLRPIDLYNFWFTRALAMRTAPLVLRAVPILGVTMLLLPLVGLAEWFLAFPASFAALAAFLLAFIGAILLSAALTMLLTVSMMWTLSGEGVNSLFPTLIIMFSGMIVPLPLFPEWIKPLLNALPFAGLLDQPLRLFTGNLPPSAVLTVLLHQGFWIVVIVLLGRFLVSQGVNKLVIQGG
ncbi:MAG: ABC transporter permease [Leptolyngbyaceae cyanobacterium RU_5_1]|nr:ABC transporter permease [Leptolyngbyaceae cyanobacterium RU_5_1]